MPDDLPPPEFPDVLSTPSAVPSAAPSGAPTTAPQVPRTPEEAEPAPLPRAASEIFSWSAQPPRRNTDTRIRWTPRLIYLIARVAILAILAVVIIVRVFVPAAKPSAEVAHAGLTALLVPSLGATGPVDECRGGPLAYDATQIGEVRSDVFDYTPATQGLVGAAAACWDFPSGDTYRVTVLDYTAADDADSVVRDLKVSSLMLKQIGTRQTIGDGEAFAVDEDGVTTVSVEFGSHDDYVFVVEANTSGPGPHEESLDDLARQQYSRL